MPKIGEMRKAQEIGKSGRSQYIWLACEICGKERWVQLQNADTKRCNHCSNYGREMPKGEKSKLWKGGYCNLTNGYKLIIVKPDDFFYPMVGHRNDGYGYMREHRLVMAKHLNRCLLPWEIVHHKNGVKNDNRLENLRLLPSQAKHLSSIAIVKKFNQLNARITFLENENIMLRKHLEGEY